MFILRRSSSPKSGVQRNGLHHHQDTHEQNNFPKTHRFQAFQQIEKASHLCRDICQIILGRASRIFSRQKKKYFTMERTSQ